MTVSCAVVQEVTCPPVIRAWMLAFQRQALQFPDRCSALVKAALTACLELPAGLTVIIIQGLTDAVSQCKLGEWSSQQGQPDASLQQQKSWHCCH